MKFLILCLIWFCTTASFAQRPGDLFYFLSKDSLIGVKDGTGKIIIPAVHQDIYNHDFNLPITDELINLWPVNDKEKTKNSFGVYYNRKGVLLLRPYAYDNGPDYLQEGLFRFVENNKVGFANRFGVKQIQAQFDFAEPFTLGTSFFCNGCYFDLKKDPEHPPLVGGEYGFIDKNGKILKEHIPYSGSNKMWSMMDSIHQTLYPKQFVFNANEQKIIQQFQPYKDRIEKKYFENRETNVKSPKLVFQIVEKPSAPFPYYVVQSIENFDNYFTDDAWSRLQFYVTKDGKKIFFHDAVEGPLPFKKWLDAYLKK
jgi:hypothetical protein